jgi:NADH-quinone oxidoreductase subunit H
MIHFSVALDIGWGTTLAIKTIVILGLVPAAALILGYTFLLKMMSHMQSRLGPMDPGGFHGWFQLIGDGIKFMQKEDITPAQADRRVFAFAPAVVVMSTFLVFLVIPAGPDVIVKDLNVGVFYALAVSSLSVIGVLMAGWASANKFALLGALRAAAQLIAYELPLLLAVVGVVVQAGTMSLQGIVEFGTAFAFAAIAATLFLGGWSIPGIENVGLMRVLGPIVLFTKIMLVAFLMFWVRFTYPRLREDQLQALAWKFLIPIGLINILATGVFKVAF